MQSSGTRRFWHRFCKLAWCNGCQLAERKAFCTCSILACDFLRLYSHEACRLQSCCIVALRASLPASIQLQGCRALLATPCKQGFSSLHRMAEEENKEEVVEREEGEEQEQPIAIFKATCIRGPGLKAPWMPAVQTIGGVDYIKLVKWDRELTMFCTGKALVFGGDATKRSVHNINVRWFQDVAILRHQACDAAVKKVIIEAAQAEGKEPPAKIRQARPEDEFLIGSSVIIDVPSICDENNEILEEARQLRVLWAVKGDLWVELTEDNLRYVRHAIRQSEPFVQTRTKRAAKSSPKRHRKRGRKPVADQEAPLEEHSGEHIEEALVQED